MSGVITKIRTGLNSMIHSRLRSEMKANFDSTFKQAAMKYDDGFLWRRDVGTFKHNFLSAKRFIWRVVPVPLAAIATTIWDKFDPLFSSMSAPIDSIWVGASIASPILLTLHLMAQGFRKGGLYTLFAQGNPEKVAEVKWAIDNFGKVEHMKEEDRTDIQKTIFKCSERAKNKILKVFKRLPEEIIDEIEEAMQESKLQNIIMTSDETPEDIANKIDGALSSYEVSPQEVKEILSALYQKGEKIQANLIKAALETLSFTLDQKDEKERADLIRSALEGLEVKPDFFDQLDKKPPPTIKEDLLNTMRTDQNINDIVKKIREAFSSEKVSAKEIEELLSNLEQENQEKAASIREKINLKLLTDAEEEVSTEEVMEKANELKTGPTKEEESVADEGQEKTALEKLEEVLEKADKLLGKKKGDKNEK